MRTLSQALAALAVVACIAPAAAGQPAPSAAPPKGAVPPALPAPKGPALPQAAPQGSAAPKGSAAPQGSAAPELPPPATEPPKPPKIEVDDPALAPVAAPTHTIQGFKEVLSLLSNQSISMKIAQQEVVKAEGNRRQAVAGVMPTVSGSAKVSYDALNATITPSPTLNPATCVFADKTSLLNCFDKAKPSYLADPGVSLSLSVTQPFSARSWYAIGTADEVISGTKLRAEDARRTAIAAAASSIVVVVTNERIAEVNRVGLRAALERLELTKRKKRLGSGTDLDIVRAEQDATTARGSIVTGDENLRKARESLGQLFNSTDSYGVPAGFSLNDIDQALRSACKVDAVENRTDVLAAKSDLKVAERGVTDVKLQYAPTMSVSSVLSYTAGGAGGGSSLLGSSSGSGGSWSIAALLTVPIWEGGARYGAAKIASAQVEEAKLKVQQTTVGATIEATQAQRSVTVADQARENSEKARDLAKETARLSQIAFETGTGTSLDLVTSGQALRQAEIDLAVKELQVVQAKIAALLALSKCDL